MNIIICGASTGIGREVALKFSESPDNKIFAVARNENALKRLYNDALNGNITGMPLDITDTQRSLKELKKSVSVEFDRIDILLNIAGYLVNKPFTDHTAEEISRLAGTNFTGPAAVISELLPLLRRGSHVVNISSMGGFQGSMKFPGLSFYSASKGALAILTECLAAEYSEEGIVFNCLCLGAVETRMFNDAFPGHRAPVSAAEMADFIIWFASEGSKFFNGKILPVAISVP
jgi:NAD(P)-dependent dehydrogenase (short-subunit alcohol dehydrogenase family)